MLKLIFITDRIDVALFAEQSGVDRILVDLETLGKAERQSGRDTLLSQHRRENIAELRRTLSRAELIVRVNPLHAGSPAEIDYCIAAGAETIMLPMFHSAAEVERCCRFVGGRTRVLPLVETVGAVRDVAAITALDGVDELHVGLNDLHLELGSRFLFEPLADGLIDKVAETCQRAGVRFGIGGVSTVGTGHVPGELVLAEHARLSSTGVILSRSFHGRAETLEDLQRHIDLPAEIARLRAAHERCLRRSQAEITTDQREFQKRVRQVVARCA